MELNGKIIVLNDAQTVGSAGTFKKRTIVIETSESYPQKVAIDFVQDKCTILDNYKIGDVVNVGINVRGNEYQGKYYVSLNGWKISKEGTSQAPAQQNEPTPLAQDSEDDGMPF